VHQPQALYVSPVTTAICSPQLYPFPQLPQPPPQLLSGSSIDDSSVYTIRTQAAARLENAIKLLLVGNMLIGAVDKL
jgi:hypothetical protein